MSSISQIVVDVDGEGFEEQDLEAGECRVEIKDLDCSSISKFVQFIKRISHHEEDANDEKDDLGFNSLPILRFDRQARDFCSSSDSHQKMGSRGRRFSF